MDRGAKHQNKANATVITPHTLYGPQALYKLETVSTHHASGKELDCAKAEENKTKPTTGPHALV